MTSSLADESGRLMVELHWALSEIDPARWRAGAAARARPRLSEIRARVTALAAKVGAGSLGASLRELESSLASAPAEEGSDGSLRARWMVFRRSLVPSYEAMQRALREHRVHVPSLRPTNWPRGIFHVSSGLVALAVLWSVPHPAWAMAVGWPLALTAWTLEIIRRARPGFNATIMRFFAPLAHPHEYRGINSGTWYLTTIALLSTTVSPVPCAVGVAVLGFGDPAAAIVGRRFGRVRLVHGRTLEGSLAFLAASAAAGTLAAMIFAPGLSLPLALALGASGAVAGAATELLSLRIDDNLTIGLVASGAAAIACALLGVPFG